ncbi:amino acid ABC transporter permease [Pelagicoccus sp. SDUM812003]|uniref:amino acid ABC transporter permease n=1 Tax=Pelagicoccus sp. SDUM812003 TaxID=3041267 RepID=UPI00280E6F06|nr:amino acid ABC transporter permease [Pelagicoccus sp. SDUM812003]MDQ8205354.1 amino acid ABC transporter permease [Pelagicoccus sp. SDUM812003]
MRSLLFETEPNAPQATRFLAKWFSVLLALSLICSLILAAFASLQYNWNWSSVFNYRNKLLGAWLTTLQISSVSLVLSSIIGALSALSSRSRFLPLRYLFRLYVEITRGTPLLVQILIYYYVIADAAHIDNRYTVGTLVLSLFSGAYLSEIFRAGIESVGSSQLLSAQAIGFDSYQTFRYIILPQALRQSLPALAGQFANLIKDSSLLSIIAISEFTLAAQEVNAATLSSFESFIPLAIGYLILTLPISYLSRYMERKVSFDT